MVKICKIKDHHWLFFHREAGYKYALCEFALGQDGKYEPLRILARSNNKRKLEKWKHGHT